MGRPKKPAAEKMVRTNLNLSPPTIARLDAETARSGLAASEIVRRALDEYLDRAERKAKKEGKE